MSTRWLEANASRFSADILYSFCVVSTTLEEQFQRFDHAGNLSFPVLSELLGDLMNKGRLWRLKDMSHHMLRDTEQTTTVSTLLDWSIGYIFHETLKLMEDAHQHQYYAPRLAAIAEANPPSEYSPVARAFLDITQDTHTDMERGVARTRRLLRHARQFLLRYYAGQYKNRQLARMLYDRRDLVQTAFGDGYAEFLDAVSNRVPERLTLEAAVSLLEGGRAQAALDALDSLFAPALGDCAAIDPGVYERSLALREKALDALNRAREPKKFEPGMENAGTPDAQGAGESTPQPNWCFGPDADLAAGNMR